MGSIMQRIAAWLRATPKDRPKDLVEFEKSRHRLQRSSTDMEEAADDLGLMIERMMSQRNRVRKKRSQ